VRTRLPLAWLALYRRRRMLAVLAAGRRRGQVIGAGIAIGHRELAP